MAHGGKDGHPFPVPLSVYDETIRVLRSAVEKGRLGHEDKLAAIRRLDDQARLLERRTSGPTFGQFLEVEKAHSYERGGKTMFGPDSSRCAASPPDRKRSPQRALARQLKLL
jgi:hypothetical protein